jgi:hypothetical protein
VGSEGGSIAASLSDGKDETLFDTDLDCTADEAE